MLKNHLKIAFRNIWKNKTFSMINILGLSIGLSASFVIGIIIYNDLSYDRFHPNGDRIYRIMSNFKSADGDFHNRGVAVPLGLKIKEGAAGIEKATTLFLTNFKKITNDVDNRIFKNTDDIVFTDASYFDIFKYHWLAGESNNTLSNPREVVLTKSRAARYFPNKTPQQAIGNTLTYNDSILVTVVGIVENFEQRSDFNFQEFLSLNTAADTAQRNQFLEGNWNSTTSSSQLFVMVRDKGSLPQIQLQLNQLAKEHEDKEMVGMGYVRSFGLQPLADLHFNPNIGSVNNGGAIASKTVLWSLSLIALFLLLLGCINFVNLNTAQATKRSKEIGIRKTLGGSKKQLVFQFLGETLLLTLAATLLSLFFSSWLLNIFSDFIPNGANFQILLNPYMGIFVVLLLILVVIMSGFYPAIVLSSFRPVKVLKGEMDFNGDKIGLRKFLTVFQFAIAQIFIMATLVVGRQLNYVLNKDMGFKTDANVYIRAWDDDDYQKRLVLVEELKALPQIGKISLGGDPPASGNSNSDIATFIKDGKETNTELQFLFGDNQYRKLYALELLAGRDRLNDTIKEYVINETYAKTLGFADPADAVGQIIKVGDSDCPIVGVMADFNQRSLYSTIKPMALIGDTNRSFYHQFNTIHFSLEDQPSNTWTQTIGNIEKIWKSIYPDVDFEVQFMDQTIRQFYEQERKASVLLKWAMGLSVAISCLGLLGLVIYTTERRTKEIGIRKVLGASLAQLNVLLCKEFLILVGIAFFIAVPIAWFGLNNWLKDFAYKTDLSWWIFALSGIAMLLIALIIISIRTVAAANVNPVKSLRTE